MVDLKKALAIGSTLTVMYIFAPSGNREYAPDSSELTQFAPLGVKKGENINSNRELLAVGMPHSLEGMLANSALLGESVTIGVPYSTGGLTRCYHLV